MSIVWRFLLAIAAIALLLPAAFYSIGLLAPIPVVSDEHKMIAAPIERVWSAVTDWRIITAHADAGSGLPHVVDRAIEGGGEPASGKVLRYSLDHKEVWAQRLTAWDPPRRYAFSNAAGGRGSLSPGDVTMTFTLTPVSSGATDLDYTMTVTSHGPFNKAVAFLFGKGLGTMRGYQTVILNGVAADVLPTGAPLPPSPP